MIADAGRRVATGVRLRAQALVRVKGDIRVRRDKLSSFGRRRFV